jgi:hypothetical protein
LKQETAIPEYYHPLLAAGGAEMVWIFVSGKDMF